MNTIDKWDTALEFVQSITFAACSIATVVMLGFDCNTAYFFLMTTNKLTDLGSRTSSTLGRNMAQFSLYLVMSLYALSLGLCGTAEIDLDADKIDSLIYII